MVSVKLTQDPFTGVLKEKGKATIILSAIILLFASK